MIWAYSGKRVMSLNWLRWPLRGNTYGKFDLGSLTVEAQLFDMVSYSTSLP